MDSALLSYSWNYTAEGIKKIGILTTLIKNRKLRKNTVLFMDEECYMLNLNKNPFSIKPI
ncbi:hypothetical protein D3C80_1524730 [compost metagenome]